MNRQGNAKQKIKDAFLSIYSEKDLNQITIRDITNYAGVYRGTFYYYYADIFDLLEDIEKDMKATAIKELIPIIKSLLNGKVTHRDLVFIENFYTKYEQRVKLFLIKKPNLKLIDFMKASIKKNYFRKLQPDGVKPSREISLYNGVYGFRSNFNDSYVAKRKQGFRCGAFT